MRNILDMMQETGKKEPLKLHSTSLLDFSFLKEAQKEIANSSLGKESVIRDS